MRIAILGAGAWGTALAVSLSRAHPALGVSGAQQAVPGHEVCLWARSTSLCAHLERTRRHPGVLPGIALPDAVMVTDTLEQALEGAQLIVVAVSVAGARSVLVALSTLAVSVPVVLACKGFELGTGLLPHTLAEAVLPPGTPVLSLSGPSFASEVAAGHPTALVLASENEAALRWILPALHHSHLRLYSNNDPTGVEVAGALKNVIAIAAGMSDGMGLGLNARAALITRGLAEIRRLGEQLGARPETFLGLAGVGDLLLTCTATLSRNYRVGQGLAGGRALSAILDELGEVAEGVSTARAVGPIAAAAGVEMPICEVVLEVVEGRSTPAAALQLLLGRDPRAEA